MPYTQSIHTSILHCLTSEEPLTITFSIVQLSTHTSTELVPYILSVGHVTACRHEYPLFCLCTFLGIFGLRVLQCGQYIFNVNRRNYLIRIEWAIWHSCSQPYASTFPFQCASMHVWMLMLLPVLRFCTSQRHLINASIHL